MTGLFENVSMKHLMVIAVSFVGLGIIWMATVWLAPIDKIWIIPGIFLIISGIVKVVTVQVWVKVAKLGTDDHKPIKAL